MKQKKEINIDYDWLKQRIESGKSSSDVANSLGVSKTKVLQIANEHGLRFKAKSYWRKK